MDSPLNIPLGFRFEPTDTELIDYLLIKIHGLPLPSAAITEADIYAIHPSSLCGDDDNDDDEKYYFVKRKKHSKNENGKRPSRELQEAYDYIYDGTNSGGGWWKATSTKDIYSEERGSDGKFTKLGIKRTLKFYNYKNNKKDRSQAIGTDWIMHEYSRNGTTKFEEWVICGIKYKGKKSSGNKRKALDGSIPATNLATLFVWANANKEEEDPTTQTCEEEKQEENCFQNQTKEDYFPSLTLIEMQEVMHSNMDFSFLNKEEEENHHNNQHFPIKEEEDLTMQVAATGGRGKENYFPNISKQDHYPNHEEDFDWSTVIVDFFCDA